jgi:hypothetical protein
VLVGVKQGNGKQGRGAGVGTWGAEAAAIKMKIVRFYSAKRFRGNVGCPLDG